MPWFSHEAIVGSFSHLSLSLSRARFIYTRARNPNKIANSTHNTIFRSRPMKFANVNQHGKEIEHNFNNFHNFDFFFLLGFVFCSVQSILESCFFLSFLRFATKTIIIQKCHTKSWYIFYSMQALNGHRKFHNTTTSLSIPSTEDEMIDITPRESNYTSTMGGGEGRQPGSPSHASSAYARDRELNDAEGKSTYAKFGSIHATSQSWSIHPNWSFTTHLSYGCNL